MALSVKKRPDAFQVIGSIHARLRSIVPHGDRDGVAVPKRPQLLESLEARYRSICEFGERSEKLGPRSLKPLWME
jgi:hypothetical protein